MNTLTIVGALLLTLGTARQDVELTAPERPAQDGRAIAIDTTVQIYDVKDVVQKLLTPRRERAELEEKLKRFLRNQEEAVKDRRSTPPEREDQAGNAVPEAEARLVLTRDLADLARRYMQPPFQPDREQVHAPSDGVLAATLGAAQHAWLKGFLDRQRTDTDIIEIGISILEGPRGAFRDVGLVEASTVLDDAKQLADLQARMLKDSRIATMTSPRLMTYSGQKASLSILNQVAYVKDWKVRLVEPGPREIADPTIDIVQDGLVADVRATALAAETYALELAFDVVELERPIPTRKIRISSTTDQEVEIGMPVVTRIKLETSLLLENGASAAFTTASPERDKDLAILVTLKHRPL